MLWKVYQTKQTRVFVSIARQVYIMLFAWNKLAGILHHAFLCWTSEAFKYCLCPVTFSPLSLWYMRKMRVLLTSSCCRLTDGSLWVSPAWVHQPHICVSKWHILGLKNISFRVQKTCVILHIRFFIAFNPWHIQTTRMYKWIYITCDASERIPSR